MAERLTAAWALERARQSGNGTYGVVLRDSTMELGYYKPDEVDSQQPHDQDEIYIVQSGSGQFVCGDERRPFSAGEALFVPAGVEHRFEEFSDDFAAWVVFLRDTGRKADTD